MIFEGLRPEAIGSANADGPGYVMVTERLKVDNVIKHPFG